jgi:ribosomal protein S6--L-glutamate ligase
MKIAILSQGTGLLNGKMLYSTSRLKEIAEARGHEVSVINIRRCYLIIEQGKPEIRYEGEPLDRFDAIIPRITPSITKYGSAVVRQLEMMGMYTTAPSIAIVRSRDKLRATQLLNKAGVGIPKTIISRDTFEVDDLIEQIGLPMIIKLVSGTHGNGVVLAETKKAAKSVVQAFYVSGTSILLQEFIEEASGTDIRAFVVGGKVVASYMRKSLDDDFRSNIHQGGSGTAIKLTDEEKKAALKAAKAMGLAICGVDLIRSNRGPLVLEVNSSPGLEGIESVTGRDVASKIIDYVEQNAKRANKKDKVGA